MQSEYLKPINQDQQLRFAWVVAQINAWAGPVFLDSGCGRGKSTHLLAEQHPDTLVIGMDKSMDRLPRDDMGRSSLSDNTCFIRADSVDFYLLAAKAKLQFERHYLLYPNPWPKAKHLQRRWHGHPVFPALMSITKFQHQCHVLAKICKYKNQRCRLPLVNVFFF